MKHLVVSWSCARYSSKTKRVSIIGSFGSQGVTLRLEGRPAEIENAARTFFNDSGTGALQLGASIGVALGVCAHLRGHRRSRRNSLKELAAAAYLFVRRSSEDSPPPSLRRAAAAARCRVPDWKAYSRPERTVMLAAFLVYSAHKHDWGQLGLKDPLACPEHTADSFYKRHIKPGLPALKESLQDPLHGRLFREGVHPLIHSLLAPWTDDDSSTTLKVFNTSYRRTARKPTPGP